MPKQQNHNTRCWRERRRIILTAMRREQRELKATELASLLKYPRPRVAATLRLLILENLVSRSQGLYKLVGS